MKHPVFSVIVPTFNRPHLLPRAINSVLTQTFTDFEIIVVDDAHNTETAEIIRKFKDERITLLFHDQNKGAAAARNTGIKASRGNLITFLDDDDEFHPTFLEKTNLLFKEAEEHPGFTWTGAIRVKDTEQGEEVLMTLVWPTKFSSREEGFSVSSAISNSFGLCIRKECLDEIGCYCESLMIGEDTDLVIRLSKKYEFRTVPEVLVKIHRHGNTQLTDKKNFEIRCNCYKRILERHIDFLSKHWKTFYVHSIAYLNLCYSLKKKNSGRKALISLIRYFPFKRIIYADFICYELFGLDYKSYCNTRQKRKRI